jgi:DNA polymerase
VTGRRFGAFLVIAGLSRERAFITNAVLCNPLSASGHNRRPRSGEVAACNAFLAETLELVPAEFVAALGRVALEALQQIEPHDLQLARHAGQAASWRGRTLVPLYHPSRRSTVWRSHEEQCGDWRRLGRIVSAAAGPAV